MLRLALDAARAWVFWAKTRGSLLWLFTVLYTFSIPKKMWASLEDRRNGVGYFSDPMGKPSLLAYWRTLAEMSLSTTFLLSKQPTEEGLTAAMSSPTSAWGDDGVAVRERDYYMEFKPADGTCDAGASDRPLVGVIILPGALVSPVAYAPLARTMARKGHPSFIMRFDFDLSIFGWDKTVDIIKRSVPADEHCPASPSKWILVGHSMGTMVIENLYRQDPSLMDGVVYMGSGNQIGDALKGADMPTLVIRGSRDPFCPAEALAISAHKLPEDAETVVVEGGNHRGFASYTWQPLDWKATITQQDQRRVVVEALTDFIGRKILT